MYSFKFVTDNGKSFIFGKNFGVIADADFGKGVPVKIRTSQGFGQIGETEESQTVSGRNFNIKGVLFGGSVDVTKRIMRRVMAPLTSGVLLYNGYRIRVSVKDPPTFGTEKTARSFTMRFYAPYPFWASDTEKSELVGTITPMFRFPVNYSAPHMFGQLSENRTVNIINDGDIRAPFELYITALQATRGITIFNAKTLKKIKLNGDMAQADRLHLYRDASGLSRADLTHLGSTSDAISWIDESTDLYYLELGDNVITASDESGGKNISVTFRFREQVVSLYEP